MDTTQSDMFGVGQYDTSTPLLNAVQEPPAPKPIEPAAPVADALDPADIAGLRDTTGLSPEEAAIFNEAADLLEAMDASTTKGLQAARDVLDKVAASEREFMPEGAAQSARDAAIERLNRSLEAPAAARPPVEPPTPAAEPASSPAPSTEFKLPDELAKSSPRYGMAMVAFGSDLDRAAYILRDKSKASNGEGKLVLALAKQGYDIDQIRKHGQKVNDALKAEAKAATGSAAAPQQALKLDVPAQQFDSTASSSPAPVKAKVEIPTTAYRKITAKTGQDRVQSAAESLRNWSTTPGTAPISMDEATRLVQAKGAILHPDAIPGLDMDAARNNRSMGRATPEVQAAYEDFYGLRRPEHLDVVKAAAVEQKLAIDNQMNQIRNQASKEGC
jgi:hypothetical protein